jgi:hypothetical protein
MTILRGRRRMLFAGAGGALALLAAVAVPASAQTAAPAAAGVKLAGGPLGMNIAPWDALYTGSSGAIIQGLMKKAGINQIRYGGGVTADYFNWKSNTDIGRCLPNSAPAEYSAKCAVHDALYFGLFSKNARAINAQSFVTVNYGSGTPALAAAWVKQSRAKAGQQVALWEIGNENYGCWEVNNELASAPASFKGYKEGVNAHCPMVAQGLDAGMTTMATSYAAHAPAFMAAMKAVSSSAQLGVPWAFGNDVGGASVGDNTEWNNTVIPAVRKYLAFVDVHWYSFNFGGNMGGKNPSAQAVLKSLFQIAPVYRETRAQLNALAPAAKIVVGETGVTYLPTTIPCTPVGALFAAGDALSWLAAGAESVDWWQLRQHRVQVQQAGRGDVHLGGQAGTADPVHRLPARLGAHQAGRAAAHAVHLKQRQRARLPVGAKRQGRGGPHQHQHEVGHPPQVRLRAARQAEHAELQGGGAELVQHQDHGRRHHRRGGRQGPHPAGRVDSGAHHELTRNA